MPCCGKRETWQSSRKNSQTQGSGKRADLIICLRFCFQKHLLPTLNYFRTFAEHWGQMWEGSWHLVFALRTKSFRRWIAGLFPETPGNNSKDFWFPNNNGRWRSSKKNKSRGSLCPVPLQWLRLPLTKKMFSISCMCGFSSTDWPERTDLQNHHHETKKKNKQKNPLILYHGARLRKTCGWGQFICQPRLLKVCVRMVHTFRRMDEKLWSIIPLPAHLFGHFYFSLLMRKNLACHRKFSRDSGQFTHVPFRASNRVQRVWVYLTTLCLAIVGYCPC